MNNSRHMRIRLSSTSRRYATQRRERGQDQKKNGSGGVWINHNIETIITRGNIFALRLYCTAMGKYNHSTINYMHNNNISIIWFSSKRHRRRLIFKVGINRSDTYLKPFKNNIIRRAVENCIHSTGDMT